MVSKKQNKTKTNRNRLINTKNQLVVAMVRDEIDEGDKDGQTSNYKISKSGG